MLLFVLVNRFCRLIIVFGLAALFGYLTLSLMSVAATDVISRPVAIAVTAVLFVVFVVFGTYDSCNIVLHVRLLPLLMGIMLDAQGPREIKSGSLYDVLIEDMDNWYNVHLTPRDQLSKVVFRVYTDKTRIYIESLDEVVVQIMADGKLNPSASTYKLDAWVINNNTHIKDLIFALKDH